MSREGPTLLINRDDAVMGCIVAHCHNGRSVHLAAADGFVTARPHIKDVGLSCVLLSYCKLRLRVPFLQSHTPFCMCSGRVPATVLGGQQHQDQGPPHDWAFLKKAGQHGILCEYECSWGPGCRPTLKIQAAHEGRKDKRNMAIMSMFATSKILMDLSSAMLTSRDPS